MASDSSMDKHLGKKEQTKASFNIFVQVFVP